MIIRFVSSLILVLFALGLTATETVAQSSEQWEVDTIPNNDIKPRKTVFENPTGGTTMIVTVTNDATSTGTLTMKIKGGEGSGVQVPPGQSRSISVDQNQDLQVSLSGGTNKSATGSVSASP